MSDDWFETKLQRQERELQEKYLDQVLHPSKLADKIYNALAWILLVALIVFVASLLFYMSFKLIMGVF